MDDLINISRKNNSITKIFYPKSIAVIGASNDIDKIGGYIFSQIKKVQTIKPFPINVKWEKIQEIKAYTNITEVRDKIDLAIIAIPGKYVIDSIYDCIKKEINNIVIISAGFKEIGGEGIDRENKIKQIIKDNNLNLIGPNCLGFLNPEINLNASFAKDIPEFGGISLISQSGAVIDAIIDWSFDKKIGFSKIVSIGNMAGISELDMLRYLKDDKKTSSIVYYMETLDNAEEFANELKEVSKTKPVIIIKPGNSDLAKKAIGSHTGSLAQDNVLVKTLIEDNNGILITNLDELFNIMIGLKNNINKNKNLIILTNAGGPGVIATDSLEHTEFNLYKLSDEEKNKFEFLPKEGSLNNPIDILGDAKSDRYTNTLLELDKNKNIGNILVLLTPQIMTDSENIANSIAKIAKKTDKNIFTSFIGNKEVNSANHILNINNIATFSSPTAALNTMNELTKWKSFNYLEDNKKYNFNKVEIEKIKEKIKGMKGILNFEITKEIFEKVLAIKLPNKQIVENLNDIDKIKINSNKKYVLKADGEEFIHKKELGGVVLGIDNSNFEIKIKELFNKLKVNTKSKFKITIEEEVKGVETIIGLKNNSDMGNFIMFGSGGTFVSIYKDVIWSKCPISKPRARALIDKTKISKVLNGFRGSKPIHFEHLYEVMIRLSYLQELFPQIKEVDLNPVILSDKGVYLVDVKLLIE